MIDGNNVFGSRPDGWWNDRGAAARRFTQRVAEWCRTHDDDVTIVFDAPVEPRRPSSRAATSTIVEASRRGRDAADDQIVELASSTVTENHQNDDPVTVVTSDRGLRRRLPHDVAVVGVGRFRELIGY